MDLEASMMHMLKVMIKPCIWFSPILTVGWCVIEKGHCEPGGLYILMKMNTATAITRMGMFFMRALSVYLYSDHSTAQSRGTVCPGKTHFTYKLSCLKIK